MYENMNGGNMGNYMGNPDMQGYQQNSMQDPYMQQPQRSARVSRKSIVDTLLQQMGAREVVLLDEFETQYARHICQGSKNIVLLQRETVPFSLPDGSVINPEFYFCRNCRKLILNKNSVTLV